MLWMKIMVIYLVVVLCMLSQSSLGQNPGENPGENPDDNVNGTTTLGPTPGEPTTTHHDGPSTEERTQVTSAVTLPHGITCTPTTLTNNTGEFSPPRLPNRDQYPNNLDCTWDISLAAGQKINLLISSIDIEFGVNCINDVLEVFDGPDENSPSLAVTCGRVPNVTLTSTGNKMHVVFKSDSSTRATGFEAAYTGFSDVTTTTAAPSGNCDDNKLFKKGSDRDSFEFWDSRNRSDIDDMLEGSGKTFSGLERESPTFNVQEITLKKFLPSATVRTRYVKQIQFVFDEQVSKKRKKVRRTIEIAKPKKWTVTAISHGTKIERFSMTLFWDSSLKKNKEMKTQVSNFQLDACFD